MGRKLFQERKRERKNERKIPNKTTSSSPWIGSIHSRPVVSKRRLYNQTKAMDKEFKSQRRPAQPKESKATLSRLLDFSDGRERERR